MRPVNHVTIGCCVAAALVCAASAGCTGGGAEKAQAKLLVALPDACNTPDGMCVMPDGSIIVSAPNVNDQTQPAVLLKVTPDNKAEVFYAMPAHPKTGKAFPMGICLAPSGDLYVADCQWFVDADHQARVLRIPMKDGRPGAAAVVASGLVIANAVAVNDGYLYVTDSSMLPGTTPLVSGVFRFKLGEEGVVVKQPLDKDPHCVATLETRSEKIKIGADGMTFDKAGNLYIGNFGDGIVHKFARAAGGTFASGVVFARAPEMRSCDGLFFHAPTEEIIVADYMANAIRIVSMTGAVRTLAANADGLPKGAIDAPCEAVVRGGEVIISNMDMPLEDSVNRKFERPATLSTVPLR